MTTVKSPTYARPPPPPPQRLNIDRCITDEYLLFKAVFKLGSSLFQFFHFLPVSSSYFLVSLHVPESYVFNLMSASVDITYKKCLSRFANLRNVRLHFSNSSFVIRVNPLHRILNHPSSFMVYYYLFGVVLSY